MNRKYTKQQIVEAIKKWQNVLNEMLESKSISGTEALFKMASQIVPNEANLAKSALNENELNEGTTSGVLMGIMGTLLALSMMGKISLNMKDALRSTSTSKDDAKVIQMCDKSLDTIDAELNDIVDNVEAIRATHNLDGDPTIEQLLDATKKSIADAEKQELFKKIMSQS